MLPVSAVPAMYSSTKGTSGAMESFSVGDKGVAAVKLIRYLSANVNDT
jgi:hypothetical protein